MSGVQSVPNTPRSNGPSTRTIIDHHGRTWVWQSKDLYVHDNLAWTERMIRDERRGLPSAVLADNPNYQLCEICTKEWPR